MNTQSYNRRYISRSRSGMILLVVMSVLALFAVMGMTFILFTGRNRESAEAALKYAPEAKTTGNSPQELLEEGIMQVIAGRSTDNTVSPIQSSLSLLGDMYGTGTPTKGNGVFSKNAATGLITFPATDTKLSGRVVTITSGKLKGNSTTIIKVKDGNAYCLPFHLDPALDANACDYIVNQRPFQNQYDYDAVNAESNENKFMSLRYAGGDTKCKAPVGRIVIPSYYRPGDSARPGCTGNENELGGKDLYPDLGTGAVTNAVTKDDSPWDIDNDGDGDKDSVWMDLGLAPRAMPDGTMVVPMYAILTEDLDGRINVNAHGQYDTVNSTTCSSTAAGGGSFQGYAGDAAPTTPLVGQGYGCAEINPTAVFGSNLAKEIIKLRNSKAGAEIPDSECKLLKNKILDLISTAGSYKDYKFSINDDYPYYRCPPDFMGQMTCVIDKYGMFTWLESQTPNMGRFPYEINLGTSQPRGDRITAMNCLYSPEELEGVLRIYDDDSLKQENRLVDKVTQTGSFNSIRHLVTTESWDLPVCPKDSITDSDNLPEEVRAGFKMDINRPLRPYPEVKNDNSGVNPTEVAAADNDRTQLAKDLYYLLRAVDTTVPARQAAQWAVNVVDFRDPDSVCTRLEVDGVTVYGVERPEALITETFAYHARMTEDLEENGWTDRKGHENDVLEIYDTEKCKSVEDFTKNYPKIAATMEEKQIQQLITKITKNKKDGPDGNVCLDQKMRPESGLFIEIYNPWLNSSITEAACPLLYSTGGNGNKNKKGNKGLNLGRLSAQGSDRVWRMVVADPNNVGRKEDGYANDFTAETETTEKGKLNQNTCTDPIIYFTKQAHGLTGNSSDKKCQYELSSKGNDDTVLYPGQVGVIGPGDTNGKLSEVYLDNIDKKQPTTICLSENNIKFAGSTMSGILGMPVQSAKAQSNRRLSVTESQETNDLYKCLEPGELAKNQIQGSPIDLERNGGKDWDSFTTDDNGKAVGLGQNFVKSGFKVVYLQRLANPYLKFNETTNPYVTIDSMPIDLYSYNGRQNPTGQDYQDDFKKVYTYADIEDKSGNQLNQFKLTSNNKNLTPKSRCRGILKSANLWCASKLAAEAGNNTQQTFSTVMGGTSDNPPSYEKVPAFYFPNRPFNSVMEMLMVPQLSAYELTSSSNCIDRPSGTKGELPNYIQPKNNGAQYINFLSGTPEKIFNFLRIQSPYSDTPMSLGTYYNATASTTGNGNKTEFSMADYRWNFREPGKLNINSIYNPTIWAAMLGKNDAADLAIPGMSSTLFTDYWQDIFDNEGKRSKTFSSHGSGQNYLIDNKDIFLLSNAATTCVSPQQSAFFQLPLMQRLSNLTTTRSNDYAVWITVGFFEYKGSGNNAYIGREYGLDNGSRQRYRAFYMIDRTRPAGYEPGMRHNAENTILLRRYLP